MLVLTACGGGGGSTSAPFGGGAAAQAVPVTVASAAPTGAPTAAPATAPQSTAQVTLTMSSEQQPSARGRSAQFVSGNATLFRSTVVSVNGSTTLPNGTPAVLTTPLSNPALGGVCRIGFPVPVPVCVVTIQAPTGTVVYQFDLFDKNGARLSTANPTFTMPANGLTAQMIGIVGYVLIFSPAVLTYGQPSNDLFGVLAGDSSGARILEAAATPFFQPFTLCNSDTSGNTALVSNSSQSHGAAANCVVFANTGEDAARLIYDGTPIAPFTLVATGASIPPGGTVAAVDVEPRIVLSGTAADHTNQSTLTFTAAPQTKPFTASQAGHSGPFGFSLDGACGTGANAIVTVATTDHVTFNATALKSGTCLGRVTGLGKSIELLTFNVP